MGFLSSVFGCTYLDFSLLILDVVKLGLSPSIQSFSCSESPPSLFSRASLDFPFFVLDFGHMEFFMPVRPFSHSDFTLSSRSSGWLEPAIPPFAASQIDLLIFPLDCSLLGPVVLTRSPARLEPQLPLFGCGCFDLFLLLFDASHMGSSMPARSPACLPGFQAVPLWNDTSWIADVRV